MSSCDCFVNVMNQYEQSFQDYVHFHVTNPLTPWSQLFSTMESAKQQYPNLVDYSVSETTLEQVFIAFAKAQVKLDNADNPANAVNGGPPVHVVGAAAAPPGITAVAPPANQVVTQ